MALGTVPEEQARAAAAAVPARDWTPDWERATSNPPAPLREIVLPCGGLPVRGWLHAGASGSLSAAAATEVPLFGLHDVFNRLTQGSTESPTQMGNRLTRLVNQATVPSASSKTTSSAVVPAVVPAGAAAAAADLTVAAVAAATTAAAAAAAAANPAAAAAAAAAAVEGYTMGNRTPAALAALAAAAPFAAATFLAAAAQTAAAGQPAAGQPATSKPAAALSGVFGEGCGNFRVWAGGDIPGVRADSRVHRIFVDAAFVVALAFSSAVGASAAMRTRFAQAAVSQPASAQRLTPPVAAPGARPRKVLSALGSRARATRLKVGRCRLTVSKVQNPSEKCAWFQRLKLNCDEPLSRIAFNVNVRRYIKAAMDAIELVGGSGVEAVSATVCELFNDYPELLVDAVEANPPARARVMASAAARARELLGGFCAMVMSEVSFKYYHEYLRPSAKLVYDLVGFHPLPSSGATAVKDGVDMLPSPLTYDTVTVAANTASIGIHTTLESAVGYYMQFPEFRACVHTTSLTIALKFYIDAFLAKHASKMTAMMTGFHGLQGPMFDSAPLLTLISLFSGGDEFSNVAAHMENTSLAELSNLLKNGIKLKVGGPGDNEETLYSVYAVFILDGLARRALLGHTGPASDYPIAALPIHKTQLVTAQYNNYTLTHFTRDAGLEADAAFTAPAGTHPLAGKVPNPDNLHKLAGITKGLTLRSLLPVEISQVWPDPLHLQMCTLGHVLVAISWQYQMRVPTGVDALTARLRQQRLRVKMLKVGRCRSSQTPKPAMKSPATRIPA